MRTTHSRTPQQGRQQRRLTAHLPTTALALGFALAFGVAMPAVQAAQVDPVPVQNQRAAPYWQDVTLAAGATARGKAPALQLRRLRAATLDLAGLQAQVANAPMARGDSRTVASKLEIALPHPNGGYQRFVLEEAPVMEAGLAAKHPNIKTYRGKGIDDPRATLRMDITQLGLHASVRSPNGGWYVDPYYKDDTSVYASYGRADLVNPRGPLIEAPLNEPQLNLSRSFYTEGASVDVAGTGFAPGATVTLKVTSEEEGATAHDATAVADASGAVKVTLPGAPRSGAFDVTASDGNASSSAAFRVVDDAMAPAAAVGNALRTYRLALVTDPSYANYFGAANVTAAKVTLINRVTQIYEDETSISLVLIDATDALNLNTAAQMTGANGPCGAAACYTTSQASVCSSGTLTRTRIVAGLLAGASNFDVGHIALGLNGGGIASLGVVGGNSKAQGCTGIPTPVGDFFAVDYVAHELGHQFSGNHTFNGAIANCSGTNRNGPTSVEPGSGSSIMAYAGICSTDNLQTHSDPYWSQRSFDEIVAYTSGAETVLSEVQMGALRGFATDGQSFQLSYNGNLSAPIVRGSNFSAAGIRAAIEGIAGWPANGIAAVSAVTDGGFTVTFGGALAGINVPNLSLVNCTGACSGFVGEITKGGATTRRGAVSDTGNMAPVVSVPAGYTIPVRTPFALTGSAVDQDDENLTYLWEQNDRGAASGTSLVSNTKTNGPLFRQFGTRAIVTSSGTLEYESPGQNQVTGNPTRVFPDMAQILANNTNAVTGACPTASATPTAAQIDCFSEFLPTAAYVGYTGVNASPPSLHFKLTARDGRGGVNSASTVLTLAPAAGPFLVTAPNTAVTLEGGASQAVTWSVANTNVAPVNTASVRITLSTDGGQTWPYVLAESVPNNGAATVQLPAVASSTARIKVEAVGNVFFDVSDADFSLRLTGDVNGDGTIDCADLGLIKAAYGKRTGQAGFDARADVNGDGVVNVRDLNLVAARVPAGSSCN